MSKESAAFVCSCWAMLVENVKAQLSGGEGGVEEKTNFSKSVPIQQENQNKYLGPNFLDPSLPGVRIF